MAAKLDEGRVRSIIEPVITGEDGGDEGDGTAEAGRNYNDDVSYVRDLGLVAQGDPIEVANPIYREVILRVLGARAEGRVAVDPRSFVLPDGRLDFDVLLDEFVSF